MGRDSKILNRGIELLEQSGKGSGLGSSLLKSLLRLKAETKVYRWPKIGRLPAISDPKLAKQTAVTTVFNLLGHLCMLGDRSIRDEMPRAQEFARLAFGLSEHEELEALHAFRKARTSNTDLDTVARRYMRLFADSPAMLVNMVDAMYYFAVRDGETTVEQAEALRSVVEIFELPEDTLREIGLRHQDVDQTREELEELESSGEERDGPSLRQRIRNEKLSDVDRAYALIGVSKIDTPEAIKAQFHKLAYRFHPDRAVAKNETADRVLAAREKFKQILSAYSLIRKDKDF
ncbi:MAG: DnaJ domain-containing protein [Bdellovibrionales bacterium]|nr:DnaJ domain-containing protein [Bdellovibrionales bacterium]